ncbi:hypothetical protein Tco_1564914 [Tanacetum coccineum]
MFSSPNTLWVNTIKALHGQDGGLDNQGCNFNGIGSRIVGTSNFLHSKDIIPLNSFRFKVGCGTRIRFWKDIWIGDSPLLTRYNRLYRLDKDKDCLIIDRIVDGHWNWNWSRDDIGIRNAAYLRDLLMEISQSDWPAIIVINHYQAPQITAGQSDCDTQPDVPTLTCAPGHMLEKP